MNKGKLIVIEGACDGIGKSTQFAMLKSRIEGMGRVVASHHFPTYGSVQGAPVESYLKGELGCAADLSPYFINSLYAMDRAVTWQTVLRPESEAGRLILLDRYTTSSLIYQSALITDTEEKCAFIDYVMDFEYEKLGIPRPDAVIFLDAPFETAAKLRDARRGNDGVENDIHERDMEFMKKVYDSAQFVADRAGWTRISSVDADGNMRSREDIAEDVLRAVSHLV